VFSDVGPERLLQADFEIRRQWTVSTLRAASGRRLGTATPSRHPGANPRRDVSPALPMPLERFRCAGETGEMLRMKEPHDEGLASHIVSESCAARPQGRRRSIDRGTRGPGIEPRNPLHLQGADAVEMSGRPPRVHRHRKTDANPARSETPSTRGRISPGNREVPCLPWRTPRPHREV
jgi:hypothetical protein